MHPFIYLWDNHDVKQGFPDSTTDICRKVYREMTPSPVFDSSDHARVYRKISLGPMVDLFIIDVQYTRNNRDSIAPGEESYLGIPQYNWLLNELQHSTAKWKLLANQKMFSPFSIQGYESFIPGGVGGDDKSWDSYQLERHNLLTFIQTNHINNVMVLSGDAHFVVVSDEPIDPYDSLTYNHNTGAGSVAVEFLPSAISSSNIDERGIPYSFDPTLVSIAERLNPHHFYLEFMDNGYGILNIKPDSINAQVWLLDARTINTNQYLAANLFLDDGANHWRRSAVSSINSVPKNYAISVYPNPSHDMFYVKWLGTETENIHIEVLNAQGAVVSEKQVSSRNGENMAMLNLQQPAGVYFLKIETMNGVYYGKLVKE